MRELPEGWEWATVEDLQAPEPRALTDGPFGSNLASRHYTDSGARVIRLQNIGDGEFIDERAYISLEHFEELRAHEVVQGDLVIASLGNDLPRVAMVPNLEAPAIVKADCIRLRLNLDIYAKWVLYALGAPETKQYATERIRGVGRPRLGLNEIKRIPVPLPPLAEQRRIVAALEEQLSRLETGELLLKTSQSRCGALESHVRDVALDALSEEPTQVLGSLLKEPLRNGYSARAVSEGGVRTLTLTAVTKNEFSDANTKMTSAENEKVANLWLNPGDILIQRSNTPDLVGTSALYSGPSGWAIFPDLLIRARVNNEVMPSFVQLVLSSGRVRKFFKGKAKGLAGSMPKIDQRTIESVEIPVPSLDRQREVVERVGSQISALTRVSNSIDKLEKRSTHLRRSLLSAAFSGKLVPQDPDDEPASVLLERIRAERAATAKPKRGRRAATRQQPASTPAPPDPAPVVSGEQTALEF